MDQRELWNDRYRDKGAVWGAEPNQFVAEYLEDLEPCRILDVGAGQGRNAIWLANRGHRVTAVDISDVAVAQAREIAREAGVEVEFIAADLAEWEPPTEAYDLVLLAYIQATAAERKLIHAKARRALAPGGRVFIIAHHLDNLDHGIGGPQSPDRLFDQDMMAEDFAGFTIEENRSVVRRVDKDGVSGDAIDLLFRAVKPLS
jgi:2-polyprenyl-3-methyl-5-hydroxy-6-metoxy-1,4-benzoquinol methylase